MTLAAPNTMLELCCSALAASSGAGLLLFDARRRQARLKARVAAAVARATARPPIVMAPIARSAATQSGGSLIRLLALLGCNWHRRQYYPVPCWMVIGCAGVAARLAVALFATLFGSMAWALLPVVWIMASRASFGRWERKRSDLLLRQFPDALAMIVRCARVGVPVAEGLRLVARESPHPTGAEFARLANEIAIGTPIDAALRATADAVGLAEYRFFATALSLQAQTGGGLTESLEGLADVIRRRIALRARGYALTSEARMSTLVLCAMPFVMGGLLAALNPPYMAVMFASPIGRKMLGVGVIMLIAAVAVMRRMIRATLA